MIKEVEEDQAMSGLGGLNKAPDGVVVGVVQLQLPNVVDKEVTAKPTTKSNTIPLATARAAVTGSEQLVPTKKTRKKTASVASGERSNRS